MYILISIFYISLIGIITMIVLKRKELNSNISPSSDLAIKIERSLVSVYSNIKRGMGYCNKKTMIALAQYITFHVLFHIRKVYVELKHRTLLNPHGRRMIDAVRGRGEVKNHGASFYLRRISER
jgi:hypothetical protein